MNKRKKIISGFLLIQLAVLFTAISQNESIKGDFEVKEFYHVLKDSAKIKEGPYELWYNGVKLISGQYANNQKDGLWKYSTIDNTLYYQGFYKNDVRNGSWKYYKNKQLFCAIYYKNDLPDSTWKSFYENGAVREIRHYQAGLQTNEYKQFYPNGNLASELVYLDKKKGIKLISDYYPNGKILNKVEYHSHSPYKVIASLDSSGNNLDYGDFANGSGTLIQYNSEQKKEREISYHNNKLHGKYIYYHGNGKIHLQTTYFQGLLHGEYIMNNEKGEIKEYGHYGYGYKIGLWKSYDFLGRLQEKKFADIVSAEDSLKALTDTIKINTALDPVYTVVEIMPEFPGGAGDLMSFVKKHLKYPKNSREIGISGKVYVKYTVGTNGHLRDVEILRGLNQELNEVAANIGSS